MKLMVYEIFDKFVAAPTRAEKVAVLQKYEAHDLRNVLAISFNKDIHFMVDRVPKYKPMDKNVPAGLGFGRIQDELKRLYIYQKDHPRRPAGLTEKRMYTILAETLSGMEAKEAQIFMNMLLKDLRIPGLDESIVREAFPHLLGK